MKRKSQRHRNRIRRPPQQRRGSTLMIVMVLMGMLSLLGVIFYVFAAQERSNAEYYSEASKELEDPGLDADVLFDWALEQIIVGTDARLKNSMLWGSRYSLLSNMVGFSAHRPDPTMQPFNGEGVNVIFDVNTGMLGVDQDRDGQIETTNAYLLDFVDSPAAQNLTERPLTNGSYPQPDAGYTYPDINSPFLCYVSKVRDQNGNLHRVVKPSYMVPGVLRPSATSTTNLGWYSDTTVKARVMRAHPGHLYVPPTQSPASPAPRYIATAAEATSLLGAGGQVFPQAPMASTYDTTGGGAGAVLTTGRMGAYTYIDTTGALETVEFDYDNDGDGVNESILIDLDFPPQQDASGKMFVPLFLVTIHDLDALMNLNAHGNLSKILYGPADIANDTAAYHPPAHPYPYVVGTPISSGGSGAWFGNDTSDLTANNFYFISQSNLGLGPAEVNPLWALNRRVGIDDTFVFTQHQAVFGNAPTLVTTGNLIWGESANMEFFWSKVGRYQTAPTKDLFVGVYGEPGILYNASTSGSFATLGGQNLPRPGLSLSDDNVDLSEGQGFYPFFQHPLDYTGQGTFLKTPKTMNWGTPAAPADPANRWISYWKYNNANPQTIKWGQATASLMTPTNSLGNYLMTQGLGDDPYEVAFYATDNRDVDSLLTADEMLYLQLNNSEIDRLNVTSRLANLLPFNFDKTKGTNSRAEYIRRKFTTQSNDRKSFSLPVSARSVNEYNVDSNTGTNKFPPQFGTVPRYDPTPQKEDPFRAPVRALLEIEVNGQQNITRPQRKLSLNGILTGGTTTPLSFRPLTTHPDDPGAAPITATYSPTNLPAYPPADVVSQEYWARRDRQLLCRDIYVLLYLLGGADTVNPTVTGAYTPLQCAQMAQFAVNLVDAMDKDVVMTRFEYDVDLSNGWSLDDDPYTSPTTTPASTESAAERGEVFGVERLDMSISEAMVIRTEAISPSGDHPATFYPDGTQHHFAYVELYNQSPFDVTFTDNAAWQVVMKQTGAFERRLSFKSGATSVPAGSRYTIGSAEADLGGMPPGKSIFKLDPNWVSGTPDFTMSTTWMAPYLQPINNGAIKGLDLLDVTTPTSTFYVEDNANPPTDLTSTTGAWASQLSTADPTKPVNFLLRRRLHPTRTRTSPPTVASENDNPWVTVDQMNLPKFGTFTLMTTMDDKTKIQTALNAVSGSFERFEPFGGTAANTSFPNNELQHATSNMGSNNTLSALNSSAVNPFTVWQPHFDRDFASIIDLFFLPLTGPDTLTVHLVDNFKVAPESQATPYSASAMILNPTNALFPNRWHRLLELVEVPTRTNRNLGIAPELSIPRVPGRLNLNMLRHPENWAGLLDDLRYYYLDMTVATVPAGSDNPPYMPDALGDIRDWWSQFLISRDGIDPYASNIAGLTIPIPGLPGYAQAATPGAKPFRSLSDVSYSAVGGTKTPSVEDTILRSLPIDTGVTKRRLVEVGTAADHGTFGNVDPMIRNRLLAKMANNSTTRSNNFAIFVSVKYFSAAADPAYGGAIRIGGPLNGKPEPEHRGFFVVDRSKLEQGKYTGSANYDFRAFIDYRKTLATQ